MTLQSPLETPSPTRVARSVKVFCILIVELIFTTRKAATVDLEHARQRRGQLNANNRARCISFQLFQMSNNLNQQDSFSQLSS